ncbi:LAFA_0A02696g1_1 [Lachancea sp. 'fantastica']|nr:LAFA_0A02696g1_1 [Lachancea sp. 'fantastica']
MLRLRKPLLGFGTRFFSSKYDISMLRNIGIIAHIDAGKTTTTERMLFVSGKTKRMGNVDEGDTITDFLPQERSRGITIQSAAISFNWQNKYKINLIDTPGHADFTFEVIRALKVLDGCVTILDAVAGVEAQTEKVWKQAKGIPKICFINKMDRPGAGFSRTVKELTAKLKTRTFLVNTPVFTSDAETGELAFRGVVDVVNQKALIWDTKDPEKVSINEILEDSEHFEELSKLRESLVETLSEFDEQLVEYFLDQADGDYLKIPSDVINRSIRKCVLSGHGTPVLAGASFRNIGVQPLLDAVVNYLPSPLEAKRPEFNNDVSITVSPKEGAIINKNKSLCVAQAFKVITDPIRGIMVYVRVYSGCLNSGFSVYNSTTGAKFKIGKLVVMHANVAEEVKQLRCGEIGVLTGSTVSENVRTGDTIIAHNMKKDGLRSLDKVKELGLRINPIDSPPPVFSAAIEPRTLGNKKVMEDSIAALIREDPSLHVRVDEETGQTLLSGMGQLHLEIAKDRLLNELNADVEVGKVMVSFKETLISGTMLKEVETETGYRLSIAVEPLADAEAKRTSGEDWHYLSTDNNYLVVEKSPVYTSRNWPLQISYEQFVNAVMSSSIVALQKSGRIGHFPLHSCVVRVKGDWDIPADATSVAQVLTLSRSLSSDALAEMTDAAFAVLEPIMNVSVSVKQEDIGNVLQDLTGARKANILSIDDEHTLDSGEDADIAFQKIAEAQYLPMDSTLRQANISTGATVNKVIKGLVPLKEMVSYMSKLRSLTQGRGTYHMSYHGMEKVTSDRLSSILEEY